MPTTSWSLAPLAAALASTALTSAAPQHAPWPCKGWHIEDSRYSTGALTAITPDYVARLRRVVSAGAVPPTRGTIDLYPTGPYGGPDQRIGSFQPAELDGVFDLRGWASSGRILATRAWFLEGNTHRFEAVIFELDRGALRTARVPLPTIGGLDIGNLVAVYGETVFLADQLGPPWVYPFVRLRILERDPTGTWATRQVVDAPDFRFGYPPETAVWLAAGEGRVVLASDRLYSSDVTSSDVYSAITFERAPDGTWSQAGALVAPTPSVTAIPTGIALEGDHLAIPVQNGAQLRGEVHLYERLGPGDWQRTQTIVRPDFQGSIAMGGGRLALTRSDDTELYERDQAGVWRHTQTLLGLSAYYQASGGVLHVDRDRLVSQVFRGTALRVVPLASTTETRVAVCSDRGAVVCAPSDPLAPTLRAFPELAAGPPTAVVRLVAGISGATPGSFAVVFGSSLFSPLSVPSTGLCIYPYTAQIRGPVAVDAAGRATLPFDLSGVPYATSWQMPYYLQAAVFAGGQSNSTAALRLVW